MIFVDTSIWIEYFRGKNPRIVEHMRDLLDQDQVALASIVWLELLSGASKIEMPHLKRVLSALPRFYPNEAVWQRVEEWIFEGIKKGQRFSATDLLIASTAAEQDSKIWSLDFDYKRMNKLGFIKLAAAVL
jgi:predicted nucleic acid-binding protein